MLALYLVFTPSNKTFIHSFRFCIFFMLSKKFTKCSVIGALLFYYNTTNFFFYPKYVGPYVVVLFCFFLLLTFICILYTWRAVAFWDKIALWYWWAENERMNELMLLFFYQEHRLKSAIASTRLKVHQRAESAIFKCNQLI